MRSIRVLSTIVIFAGASTWLFAACAKKDDTSLGAGATGGSAAASGSGGTSSVLVTGGSSGSGGASSATTGGTDAAGGSSGDGTGPGPGEAGGGAVPACDELRGLGSCGASTVSAKLRAVNMLLVIDKSGSMTDPLGDGSKWTALRSALANALGKVRARMNFGLLLYPYSFFLQIPEVDCGNDCCDMPAPDQTVLVPVSAGTTALPQIGEQLDAVSPGGGTPTAAALQAALDYYTNGAGADLEGDKYVLLATDGGPNCNAALTCDSKHCTTNLDDQCSATDPSLNCCAYEDSHILCLDDEAVRSTLDELKGAGISTFVVGLPGSQQYGQYLDSFAEAGGVPAQTGDTSYYAVSDRAGVQGLTDVFQTITEELVHSCELPFADIPSKTDLINVAVDCEIVPPSSDDGSGWTFDDPKAPTAIELTGPICDHLQQDGAMRVDVVVGCPTVR